MADSNRRPLDSTLQERITRDQLLRGALGVGASVALGGTLAGCGGSGSSASSAVGGQPRHGGKLRIAYIGGGTSETLDPNAPVADIDDTRTVNLFDGLVRLDPHLNLKYLLAESFESNTAGDEWTVRLRKGVTFHDGSPLTVDDVLYTLQRIANPKNALNGQSGVFWIDFPRVKKLDPLTLRLPLTQTNQLFPYFLTDSYWAIVKTGTTKFTHPIGTGPFEFVKWTPGQYSLFKRNKHYWDHGKPYLDELELLSIPDPTARFNALQGGQVDGIESLSYSQANNLKQSKQSTVLEATGSSMVPIYMAVDLFPFQDVRVRQAMRLIADRPQLVQEAQSGYGTIGNDIFGKGLPHYDSSIPQRTQDLEKAKFLLKAAGHEGLKITLYTSTVATGMLESATVFAHQAAGAGVTVHIDNMPANIYFGPVYLKQNFAQSEWFTESIVTHWAKSLVKGAPFNETHWHDPQFQSLYNQLLAEHDPGKQQDLFNALENILWDRGGYLIWGFYPLLDGLANNVRGIPPAPVGPLGGSQFATAWLA
jgi:peptide/nickel transport system substrate-binding protein